MRMYVGIGIGGLIRTLVMGFAFGVLGLIALGQWLTDPTTWENPDKVVAHEMTVINDSKMPGESRCPNRITWTTYKSGRQGEVRWCQK